jgi:hypothetical protein
MQTGRLEDLVRDLEKVAFHLTSRKQTTALTAASTHSLSPLASASVLAQRSSIANPMASTTPVKSPSSRGSSGKNLMEFTPQAANGLAGQNGDDSDVSQHVPRSKNDFNSISEALVQVEALRQELERVQVGLTLLCFSVDKLTDIVSVEPPCCPSLFDLFVPRTQQSIGRDSVGLYVTSQRRSPGASADQGNSAAGSSGVGNRLANVGAKASSVFKNHRIRQAGYKDINAANSNMFSIEGNDDDDEM